MAFDQESWDARWQQVLAEHPERVAERPPNGHLVAYAQHLPPGRVLDAGCGHGAEATWLAARGWRVTAVDFSAAALAHARSTAEAIGADVAGRIEWVRGDLSAATAGAHRYDLVVCLYVHAPDSAGSLVQRLADTVAPGGTLFLVGHRPVDPATGAATAAADQVQVSVEAATAALDPAEWTFAVAEERPRAVTGSGVDAVIAAQRRS